MFTSLLVRSFGHQTYNTNILPGKILPNFEKTPRAILFPGQGAQYVGMGKDLFMSFPSARLIFEEADESLGTKLSSLIFDGQQKDLTLTQNAQPAILATSIAALKILESEFGFDVQSSCTYALGHSLGEYSALVAAKSLSLYDAIRLVRRRGESMAKTVTQLGVKTAMAALVVREENLPKLRGAIEEVCSTLPEGEFVELANLNSSFQAVISGTSQAVDQASRFLQSKQLAARAVDLPVSAPFHCKLMQPAAEMMKEALNGIKFQKPIVDVISNVTASPIKSEEEIPSLLFRQVTSTVQWQRSIKYCREKGLNNFILFGPARVLANLLKKDFPLDHIRPFTTVKDIELFADCIKLKHANTL
ncbi:hypothetical protein Glove_194g25 [Diversispora epigaea]|uniref:[acyl-carrier-protein] S-malonyltransferase n=1 Tax=Diversispora epigaea TaxID=1348612 RepID=A0A397INU4_9GLOM|nr:hypothetical protein Glove_194g25 [Diversispora epigaea]